MHCSFCRVVCLALIAPVLLFSSPGVAEDLLPGDEGMEMHLFRPAVDTKGHFTTDGTTVLPHLAISLGMMLDFGFNHWMAVEQTDDFHKQTVMERAITANFMFNLGLFNRFVLGIQIPIAVTAGTAYDGPDRDEGNDWSNKGGLGLALHVKASLLRADRYPIGLGAIIQYQFGSGQGSLLMGSPGNAGAISGKIIADMQPVNWYRLALNVGARFPFSAAEKNYLNSDFNEPNAGDQLLFRYGPTLKAGVGQSFGIWPGRMDFVVELYLNQLMTRFGDPAYLSMEANAGVKIYIDNKSYLIAGAGAGIPVADTDSGYGFQSSQWRLFLGIRFEPSIGDRDGDGIPDDADQCPDDPEDLDGFEDSDGCPELDNDRDGIPDTEDDCPLVPEDQDGDEDEDGCPEHEEQVQDRDGDGIIDDVDECPDEPEDRDGFEDADGCPDLDNDRDGIPDAQDNCPLEREILNGVDDEDGCPDEGEELVKITDDQFQLLKGINFKYDSDEIVGEQSFEILNAVVAVLKASTNMKVRVEGHTDSMGTRRYNLGLSKRRAASVVRYLAKNGVAKNRLKSQGFGPDQPIASNETDEGRAKNRRVVFAIVER